MADKNLPPGSSRLEVVSGVRAIHEEDLVLNAMLKGWSNQMKGGRGLKPKTIVERQNIVRRFVNHSNEYPWKWTAGMVDEWMTSLTAEEKKRPSTIRNYQGALRMFCDYITSPYYDWPAQCIERFGTHPTQVCHEWNTLAHLLNYEGDPRRRPMTRDEVQKLLDFADSEVERTVRSKRKGALAAYRDATIFKVLYAWGLRCNEACRLDLVDLHKNVAAPEFGRFGILSVRWGKATRGSPPKRRDVVSVMPWAVEALADYIENVRPLYNNSSHPGLWLTERGRRLRVREVEERFARYRDELKLPQELTPHCLRHSYVTHLVEDGVDARFIQEQVGHAFQSTTAIYTSVSRDFMNTMMRKAVEWAFEKDR